MILEIKRANKTVDFKMIEKLAYEIIPEFYSDILPQKHCIFFVKKFQTLGALLEQLKNGYEYYLLDCNEITIGYFGLQINEELSEMVLSKLYLLKEHRGLGHGTKAMDFIVGHAYKLNLAKVTLTVNRKNERTIRLYKKYGFSITRELVNNFENGYTILDFEMTKFMTRSI